MYVKQELREYEGPLIHAQFVLKCELDKHKVYVESINLQGLCLKIQVFGMIANRIDTPEAYSEAIKKSKECIEAYRQLPEAPHEGIDFIRNELIKEGINDRFLKDVVGEGEIYPVIDNSAEGRSIIYEQ